MYQFGEQVFISYRGRDYDNAKLLQRWLLQNRYCQSAILFPRNSLSSEREILLTYEYFELMEVILDELAASQTFVFLDTSGYWASYFTQIEVAQWRRFSKKNPPEAYRIADIGKDGRPTFGQWVILDSITNNQKSLLASISIGTNRRMQRMPRTPATTWSKYARNCFLVCCAGCGEYILISQKVVYSVLKNHNTITCPHSKPHSGSNRIIFREEAKMGNFYRKPIIQEQIGRNLPRLLGANEIIQILVMNDPPSSIPVITLEDEILRSDLQKIGRFYAMGVGVIAAGLLIANWFNKKDE